MNIHKPLPKTALIQKLESEIAHLVEDLFIASPPAQSDKREEYFNSLHRQRREVMGEILVTVTSARLDEFSSKVFTSTELNEPTERDLWHKWVSLQLFCNDVGSVLCNHYGDIDREALAETLMAVFAIVFVHSLPYDNGLCIEWLNAVDLVEGMLKSPPYVDVVEAADTTRSAKAIHQNNMRARAVLESPSNFSKYTVQFAKMWQSTNPPDMSP